MAALRGSIKVMPYSANAPAIYYTYFCKRFCLHVGKTPINGAG